MENTAVAQAPAAALTRRRLRLPVRLSLGAAMLSIGTLASGVLAYAFNLLAARSLGAEAYGHVAVLWAGMFLVSVVAFRPVEQMLSRGIADRAARGIDARPVLRAGTRLALLLVALITAVAAAAFQPLSDHLFDGSEGMTLALWAGIAGYAVSYWVRGIASGLQQFDSYGLLLLVDGAARVVIAIPLLFVASPTLAATAIVLAALFGPAAPLAVEAWRRRGGPRPHLAELLGAGKTAEPFAVRPALAFAAPVAIVAGAEQVLVSGGALLVAIDGSASAAAAAGTVFAATMLVRAPVFLFQGVAAALLPKLTTLHATGERRKLARGVALIAGGMLALSAGLAAASLLLGPEAMTFIFGDDFVVGRVDLAVLSAGVGTYLAAATLGQAALAQGRAALAAAVWASSAALFVAVELGLGGSPFHRVSVAFTVATGAACVLLAAALARKGRNPRA
jgi:O-antigen/teichoic acid export membrane protein